MSGMPTDDELARAAGRGDTGAFRELVERHRARVFGLARRLVRDPAEAEDMTQEAFLRIHRGLPGFRGEAAFTTWMTRVALNTFHRYLRRLPRVAAPAPPGDDPDAGDAASEVASDAAGPEDRAAQSQAADRVRRLVAGLPGPFRDAVALFYLQEKSVEEAATVLGVSIGTLKSRLFRGREMLLRRWLAESGGAPGILRESPATGTGARVAREGRP
jgi:RNA polymerase sigma-70 factor (ECF subfamily)